MIPLCLVTGFLGAGKTTLLKRIIADHPRHRLLFIVNDFPPKDVDGARLDLADGHLFTVAGGSIFCRCKVTELIAALRQIRLVQPPPDAVVVEASGMADPTSVGRMLDETALDRAFRVSQVVTVADPVSLAKLWALPAIRSQVAAASLILLNKTDLAPPEARERAKALIRGLNEHAPVVETVKSAHRVDLFAGAPPHLPAADYAQCRDPDFASAVATIDHAVDWLRLRKAVDALGESLLRAKGTIPLAQGFLEVDFAIGGWNSERRSGSPHGGLLALIVRGTDEAKATALARDIEAGYFAQGR